MKDTEFGKLGAYTPSNYTNFAIDMLCPHCGYYTPFHGPQVAASYVAVQCHRCRKPVLLQYKGNQLLDADSDLIVDYYPKRIIPIDPYVPQEIGKDYLEAERCFSVGAWHACAVMARRCMHQVMARENAEGRDLFLQINHLKESRIITPTLAEAAQRVRVLGNHGAHPYDFTGETLEGLDMTDAQDALEFCEWVFDQVYVQPRKIEASRNRSKSSVLSEK
jgi:hypothetical protein